MNNSQVWFEFVFHLTMVVAALFMIRGGRLLTLLMAVMLWSLHYRNQDILEGGDNLAQILIIFMVFSVTNAYFAPGAKQRRARLRARGAPTFGTAVHNLAAYLVLFQIAVVYLASGYWKIAGTVWQQGVAMYYISRINGFDMSTIYAHVMANPFIGTGVSYTTIFIELAFPFAILSGRAWIRKAETLTLEAMHAGIMVFMGLVCFGLIMIGADCTALRDEDYRALWNSSARVRARLRMTRLGLALLPPGLPARRPDTRDGTAPSRVATGVGRTPPIDAPPAAATAGSTAEEAR